MTDWLRRLRYLVQRDRLDRELADEMAFHAEMAARDGGRPFGNALRLREEARDAWGWTWVDRCAQDVRYAVRVLRRSPGFTLAAVLTLAIGIGVNVAAFGFVNVVLLKPLPVSDPETIVRFQRRSPQQYASSVPYPEMAFVREHARTLSAVLAQHNARLALEDAQAPLRASFVTPNFFSELGASARLGRLLDPVADAAAGGDLVAVLSEGFWERHLGSDPRAVGRAIRLNGQTVTIVGVAPRRFSGLVLDDTDAWVPIVQHPRLVHGSRLLTDFSAETIGVRMWGRLAPGVGAAAAEQELAGLVGSLRRQHPAHIWEGERLRATPAGAAKIGGGSSQGTGAEPPSPVVQVLVLLGTLSFLILAVACSNLGSLLLARGVAREREIAIRAAIGAGRGRLMRQLFTESLVLALLGAAAGVGLGYAALRTIMATTGAPEWLDATPDWRVLGFAATAAVVAAVLFGLAPAFHTARQRRGGSVTRQVLIGAQVAASCVLLVVAGLLVRALDRATSSHPGFDVEHVLAVDPALAAHGYAPGEAQAYFDAVEGRLAAVSGVTSLSYASTAPLGRRKTVVHVEKDGRTVDVHVNRIDPRFFQTMGIPLLRGRNLARGETGAVVVSESLGLLYWAGQDPVGREFDGRTIVGVAANARAMALQDPDAVEAYYPAGADDMPSMVLLVKAAGPSEGLAPFVASVARDAAPAIFPEITLLKTSYGRQVSETRMTAVGVGLLGASALLLACLGIVGLVAYSVSQRTKEIGIRMALGARGTHVLSSVLRQLLRPTALGLVTGVVGAALVAQLLRRQLYGVSHVDPIAYASAIGLFALAALLAALGPARRALRVDPLKALRYE